MARFRRKPIPIEAVPYAQPDGSLVQAREHKKNSDWEPVEGEFTFGIGS